MSELVAYEDDVATLLADEDSVTELNGSTRCDAKCNARAYVAVAKPDYTELLFCAHHYHKLELSLAEQGWFVTIDNRDTLVGREESVHA